MFTYREAKQRCLMYGFVMKWRDGQYLLESKTCTFQTDDLDDAVFFASRFNKERVVRH